MIGNLTFSSLYSLWYSNQGPSSPGVRDAIQLTDFKVAQPVHRADRTKVT